MCDVPVEWALYGPGTEALAYRQQCMYTVYTAVCQERALSLSVRDGVLMHTGAALTKCSGQNLLANTGLLPREVQCTHKTGCEIFRFTLCHTKSKPSQDIW